MGQDVLFGWLRDHPVAGDGRSAWYPEFPAFFGKDRQLNDPQVVTLLAVAAAVLGAWLWVRRRWVRHVVGGFLRPSAALTPRSKLETGGAISSAGDKRLFYLSLVVFAATRLIGIEEFPTYFFTDEAANTVLAAEFVQNGFRDAAGQPLPVYFHNSEKLSLGVSVYVQLIPYLMFGASVFVTRATSALIALSGAAAVGLILKDIFRTRLAWLAVLLLVITPSWFLHSRTAFETSLFVSMFAWFLYFYLRYRAGHQGAIFPAVIFAALAFYSYNAGQPGLVLCGLLLAAADARFHWEHRRTAVLAGVLAVALAIPYLRFERQHPGEIGRRLQMLDSYLVQPDLPPAEKAARFAREYVTGLSPRYWYAPDNSRDLIRHRMMGYGNILWPTLPLGLIGLGICLRRWRDPRHRAVLIAALTAPVGAALTGMHITRVLVFVVPAGLLTCLGVAAMIGWVDTRLGRARTAAALFALLSLAAAGMLWDSLMNGPTWYSDYGLAGMQYGARQVYSEISSYLADHPRSQVWLFPTAWNGADMLRRFFAPDDPRLMLFNLDSFLEDRFDAAEQAVLALTADDYERVLETGKFAELEVYGTVPLPDGSIGFYLVKPTYAQEANSIFAAERDARRRMVQEVVDVFGRRATVRHTPFAEGSLRDLLDGDAATAASTAGVNPAVIEIEFRDPVRLPGLRLTTWTRDLGLTIVVFAGEGIAPGRYDQTFTGLVPGQTLDLVLDPTPGPVRQLTIEIRDLNGVASTPVRLGEISLPGG